MASYKVVDADQLDADLGIVADAIRSKGGTSADLAFPGGFVSAVENIETGGGTEDLNDVLTEQEELIAELKAVLAEKAAGGGSTDIEDAFITKSIEGDYVNDRVTTIGQQVFRDQTELTSVNFPIVTLIGDYSFAGCTAMAEASLPLATRINSYAFLNCEVLEKADFPLVTDVYGYAFRNCYALKEVNLPLITAVPDCTFDMPNGANNVLTKLDFANVTSIKAYAFRKCAALEALILRADGVATLGNTTAFTGTPIASGTGYIYVPAALVDSYKTATNWSTYAAQIRAIEDYPEICGEVTV